MEIPTRDGATLVAWVKGSGRPLVLVHGSLGDHTGFAALVERVQGMFKAFSVDRRGFGASHDVEPYSIDREFDDIAAVVDEVAHHAGRPVTLFGHSFGANCAMGGAARTSSIAHLVLYEPSLGMPMSIESIEAIEREVASGNREAAVLMVLADQLAMTGEEIAALRSTPRWPALLAGAHTMPREARVEAGWVYKPGQFAGISAPTLLLAGSESPDPVARATMSAAAAIPEARIRVLAGHGHFAHRTEPDLVVRLIREFVEGSESAT